MTELDVIIVGGGISGLSAAYELTQRGRRVRLFERAPRCGGVIRTERVDGFLVDPGPDTLLAHKPAAIDLCRALGLDDRFVRPLSPRTLHVVRRDRLRALPDASMFGLPTSWKAMASTRAFSWPGKIRMGAEFLVPARLAAASDESIASFVGRRFGRHAVDYLAEPLLAGIHHGDAVRLSMRSLYPQWLAAERTHGSVLRALASRPAQSGGGGSLSLRGGVAELTDRLVDALPAGTVATAARVRRISRASPFTVELATGERMTAPAVILATPAHVIAALVEEFDVELGRLCRAIPHASIATVAVGYARHALRRPLSGWGVAVPPREGRRLRSVSCVSSKWPDRAARGDVLLRAQLGGPRDPHILDETDSALVGMVENDMREMFGISGAPVMARVYRWPRTIPQLEIGHHGRMAQIDQRLSHIPGLYVTAAGLRGVGIADCVGDARSVAETVSRYVGSPEGAVCGRVRSATQRPEIRAASD